MGVNMIFGMKVNGETAPKDVAGDNVVFSWEYTDEDQFTLQMSMDPEFKQTIMYIDTKNPYYIFDGSPLKCNTKYYWRVRKGIGKWTKDQFITRG